MPQLPHHRPVAVAPIVGETNLGTLMLARFTTLQGDVEVFYPYGKDPSEARVYWKRKWWQLRRRPVEDARLRLWCIERVRITRS